MKYSVSLTDVFTKWVRKLKDRQAARAIALRIDRAILGNFGDVKAVGGGVYEMRIFIGKGYRVYYVVRGEKLIVLLCGGDKSTQAYDINKAKTLAKSV